MKDIEPVAFATNVQAAMFYADKGYLVFPVWWNQNGVCACPNEYRCERPAKHPITIHGLKEATTDKKQIAKWWHQYPQANIGVRTGPESGIAVIDLDVGPNKDGPTNLRKLYKQYHQDEGDLHTCQQRTGSGGIHLIFKYPDVEVKNLSTGLIVEGVKYEGIDVRGNGGYILAAPSRNLKGDYLLYDLPVSEMPKWLLKIITERNSVHAGDWDIVNEDRFDDTYGVVSAHWPTDGRHSFALAVASIMLKTGVPMRIAEQVVLQANENVRGEGVSPHSQQDLVRCVSDAYATGISANYDDLRASGLYDKVRAIGDGLRQIWKGKPDSPVERIECNKKHEAIKIENISFLAEGNRIYEQVSSGLVVWDTSTGKFVVADHVHTGEFVKNPAFDPTSEKKSQLPETLEIVYYPVDSPAVKFGQITFPDFPFPHETLVDIAAEIEEKSKKWIYISPEEWPIFRVQIRIAMSSWFLYVFDDTKIPERIAGLLSVVGVSGGGKKRFLTLMRMITYRPLYTLNSTKIPSTFRMMEPWGAATLLVDEADQKDTGSEAEWIQFFNSRYDGTPISRYNTQGYGGNKNEVFRSFGLTAFALRRLPKDEGTISRMTKINATISPVALPELAGPEIYADFAEIRNKLLYMRLKHYGKLKFVGTSGLPAEHSWRGKEVLTLIRVLSQIDAEFDSDLLNVSKDLTKREVQNLASSWDGLIINEIYDFITNDDTEVEYKGNDAFFLKSYRDKNGEDKVTPLTLMYLAKRLGTTATDIQRSVTQFKMGVLGRSRIGDGGRQFRGVISLQHPDDTDRVFMRYIPDYDHALLKLKRTQTLDGDPSVPPVPVVPPTCYGEVSRVITTQNNNNNTSIGNIGGTVGTHGTDVPKLTDIDFESVSKWAVDAIQYSGKPRNAMEIFGFSTNEELKEGFLKQCLEKLVGEKKLTKDTKGRYWPKPEDIPTDQQKSNLESPFKAGDVK